MPNPTLNDVVPVNEVMTNLSIGFRNKEYFWDKVAPSVSMDKKSGTYFKWPRDYWFRSEPGADRAPATGYTRLHLGVETDTYSTTEKGYEELIDDSISKASQTPEALDTVAIQHLTEQMQLYLEKLVAGATFKTGVWGTSLAVANKWSDYAASDPIADSDIAKRTIRRNTGMEPNAMFMGALVWERIKEHPDFLDKYKHTQSGIMTPALIAAALEIDNLYIGKSIENTAKDGQTFSGTDIWTDNILYLNVTPTPGLMAPNGAYTFIWDEVGNVPWAIQNYREESVRSDVHRIFTHPDVEITSKEHGYILLDAVA